jgi:hypothetical protein
LSNVIPNLAGGHFPDSTGGIRPCFPKRNSKPGRPLQFCLMGISPEKIEFLSGYMAQFCSS